MRPELQIYSYGATRFRERVWLAKVGKIWVLEETHKFTYSIHFRRNMMASPKRPSKYLKIILGYMYQNLVDLRKTFVYGGVLLL